MEKRRRQWCVETDKIRVEVKYLGKRQREISVYPKGSKEAYFTETLGEAAVSALIRALN